VGKLGSLLEWRGSTSTADTHQDLRFSLYQAKGDDFILTDNSTSGFMFFNDLEDTVDDVGLDWTTFFSGSKAFGSIKGGLATTASDRGFVGRRIRFKQRSIAGIDLTQSPEVLFDAPYINPTGFEIEETTRPTDAYVADQQVDAAYAMLDWSLNKWRVIGGIRYEASDINLQSRDIFNPEATPVTVALDDTDWLPSLGLVYRLNQKSNLRFSASQTVNRPEFRELAPFKFSDAVGFFERRGNPDLVSATIRSYDARWEWFPTPTDVVALSLFVKQFDDPIETVIVEAVTSAQTWINTDTADNQGFEVELRRTLNPEARNIFTVILNYSYIDSQITIPEGGTETNPQRRMVGQPDNVGNFVVEWLQPDWGSSLRLLYNYTGERVAFAGANGLPDVLEQPFGRLDLAFQQQLRAFGLDWTFKLSGENLTDETWEFTQAGELFHGWDPGTKYGVSIGLTFF
jgi:TonB-dependent receptor